MARKGYPMSTRLKALALCATGRSDEEVAALFGVHKDTIRNWRTKPEYSHILQKCQEGLLDQLEENALLAIQHLKGVLLESDDSSQMTAAIQSLKAHSNATRAIASKQIGDAVEHALSGQQLQERRRKLLSQVRVLDATGTDDD